MFTYQLGWATLFPDLDDDLVLFLISTSAISLALSFLYRKKCVWKRIKNNNDNYRKVIKLVKITYILFICDCVFSGSFPLLAYVRGGDMGAYKEVGVPFLHVFVINIIAFLFYFSSYCYLSAKSIKNKFWKPMALTLLLPILYFNRGEVLFLLFGLFLIYLLKSSNLTRKILYLIPLILFILYSFGVAGNFRSNDPSGEYILKLAGASDDFIDSAVPNEFFWGYVYIATPLGTLQNAINLKKDKDNSMHNGDKVIIHEVLPKFISKRLNYPKIDSEPYKVVNELTVGTTYFDSYVTYGWRGMWIVFVAMMIYCAFMLAVVPHNSIVRIPLLCVLSTMTFFSLFSNMITYMAIFPQLVIAYTLRNRLNSKSLLSLYLLYRILYRNNSNLLSNRASFSCKKTDKVSC